MRTKPTVPKRKPRKSLVEIIESRQPRDVAGSSDPTPYDKARTERSRRKALDAADQLLREMDDFLKSAPRKH